MNTTPTTGPTAARPSRGVRTAVLLLVVVAPLVELWGIIRVGQLVGAAWTFLALVAGVVLGGWLIARQGRRTFATVREALSARRSPHRELTDGVLVLLAGVLLALPGFLGDAVAVLLLLPPVRALCRGGMVWLLGRTLGVGALDVSGPVGPVGPGFGPGPDARNPGPDVVRGDVVED